MKDVLDRLGPLISAAQLQRIRLVEASCRAFPRELGEPGEVDLRLNWSAKSILREAGVFSVLADIEVLLIPSGSAEVEGARIWARFELNYSVPPEVELNEGLLEEFAKSNGVFNAWSYWREFVQNTLVRMELPPFPLPLYRMSAPTTKASGTAKTHKT